MLSILFYLIRNKMRSFLIVVVVACFSWAYGAESFNRRAVVSALNSAQVLDAAKAFAGSIGSKSIQGSRVSKSFEDACLGDSNPILPTNPWNFPSLNPNFKLNSLTSLTKSAIGKRQEEDEKLANRDIVFVLDTSASVPQDQFDKAKEAIALLVESFCPSSFGSAVTKSGNKQVSVVLFGSTVTTEVDFSDSERGLGYLQDKIMDMTHRREGSTATGDALTYVKNKVLGKGSSRLNNEQVSTDVIVITDGQCNRNCRVLGSEAENIRKLGRGVNVFAMGVANARACELEIITGKGTNLAYGLGDFRNFDRFAQAVKEIALENESKCA